jgi:AraC-like DNA-binding protein
VSFPTQVITELAAPRYAPWPWVDQEPLRLHRLNPAAMERLHGWTSELSRPGAGRLDIDVFVLDVVRLLARGAEQHGLPLQFEAACASFMAEGRLLTGTPGLARLVGCTPEHLNRLCRRWHGCTASDVVARLRIEWAARELRLTVRPIAEIAEASGMPHLGHFYRRFKERYGTTPKAWRAAAWGMFSPTQSSAQ